VSALTQFEDASPALVAAWALGLVISGAGVGIAWPHLSAWAMSKVDDPAEGPAAAAAINTVQVISAAFGAALAGVVVNVMDTGDATAARWLFGCFAVLAALAALATVAATRSGRPQGSR
ncbi:MFS transporter, partial [Mycobacterium sp. ITM-2017-0098]